MRLLFCVGFALYLRAGRFRLRFSAFRPAFFASQPRIRPELETFNVSQRKHKRRSGPSRPNATANWQTAQFERRRYLKILTSALV